MGADFEWNKKTAYAKKVLHDKHVTKNGKKRERSSNIV